jgi:hypothetical protein
LEGIGAYGEQADVCRGLGGDAYLGLGRGADGVDAGLEPLQADEGEPAIGSGEQVLALGAPGGQILTTLCIAGARVLCGNGESREAGEGCG